MTERGTKPDKITFTTLIDGFCKDGDLKLCRVGRITDAGRTLRERLRVGTRPDDATVTVAIDEGHSKHGNSEDFDKLSGEKGLVLDYASYTPLLASLHVSVDV
ncbi:hypothetical protein RHSIM_Rhsim10G0178800 [Rhododendron simsii]|uniref:Uncharacterized protein n=1 Tax=Rhododendron simsii TaxID=118357 RepID=A0A834G8X0_RHOSS|nr:hypothetical protein RHSIM_Rhsim10G0178800 [Rhododendron simsii]